MDKRLIDLRLGAMLYDIGIIAKRAGDISDIDEISVLFREKKLLDYDSYSGSNLDVENLAETSFAYLIYEALSIAIGIDIRKYEDENIDSEMKPLNSIFNTVRYDMNNIQKAFLLDDINNMNMPLKSAKSLTKEDYKNVWNDIVSNIQNMNDINPKRLLDLFEAKLQYIPYAMYGDRPDISYYDHIKLTSAIVSSLYLYDRSNNITNFKEEYYSNDVREKEKFIVVSGQFSGIQDFIYSIISKRAMKSLRGRSFYLELFIEHIIDEILSSLELSRENLIYSGGSQFYLLLPNIDEVKTKLDRYKDIVNDFLIAELGARIYFEMVYTPTSAEELGNGLYQTIKTENKIGDIFRRLSVKASKGKINRYSKNQLELLLDEDSEINKIKSYTKECKICKKSEEENDLEICANCNGFIELGESISKLYHKDEESLIMESNNKSENNIITLPKIDGGVVNLSIVTKKQLRSISDSTIHRLYSINCDDLGEYEVQNLWIGHYNTKKDKNLNYGLIEFEELVDRSKGIKRLAVMRADVDNLGSLFQRGFEKDGENKYKYATFSKNAVLSRYLSEFFKRKINLILEKNANIDNNEIFNKYSNIISDENTKPREIVLVYSGGDDLFAIGTWNDIIEFAVDLRQAFKEFTNEKITLSAGIGFFHHSFPVYQMANITGELESMAKKYPNKDNPTKDAIALFGNDLTEQINHIYSWDDFIDGVLNEKYIYLKQKITLDINEKSEKIFIGKSKLYRLMNLIKLRLKENDRLDIARFAYTLARISNRVEYEELKKQLFSWIKNEKDSMELLTAINLIIYSMRGE